MQVIYALIVLILALSFLGFVFALLSMPFKIREIKDTLDAIYELLDRRRK